MAQREDWVTAAVRALRAGGVEAVRVEALARGLGVTKGSFYWHFAGRPELLEALLALWEAETVWLVAEAEKAESPAERLLRYFELVVRTRGYPPDRAIFAWAAQDRAVARRAERTEALRVDFLRRQFEAHGLVPEDSAQAADALYLATLGWLERAPRVRAMPRDLLAVARLMVTRILAAPALA